jgi:surface polysaccharide O-acyltransferase-like enzyme
MFFFVNGMLLLNGENLDLKKHIHKTINILIFMVVWSVITLIALGFIRNEVLSPTEIVNAIWTFKYGWNNHLWFLKALFIIYIFYPLIFIAYKTNVKIFYFFFACVMISAFGSVFLDHLIITINFIFDNFTKYDVNLYENIRFNPLENICGFGLGYFILGGFLFKYKEFLNVKKFRIASAITIPLCMFLLALFAVMQSIKNGFIWDNVWNGFDTVFTLLTVVAVFILSMNYKSCGIFGKLINIIGENSLGIYVLHIIIGVLFMSQYEKWEYATMLLPNFVFSFFILLCSLAAVLLLKKVPIVKRLFII